MKHVRFLDVARALHPRLSVVKAMALLKAYFDESWTRDGQGVTAIAGYVGAADVWDAIETPWRDRVGLYADKGVRSFHMKDCCGAMGYGEFADVDTEHRLHIINALSSILQKSNIQPIWSAVYGEDWNAAVQDADFLKRFPSPFALCFEHVVQQLWGWAKRHSDGERVVPMFAFQPQYAALMSQVGEAYEQFPWYRDVLGPLAFDYPDRNIPLQAADLLAHEISWEWDRVGYGPPPTLMNIGIRRVLEKATAYNGLHQGGCFDANALSVAVERYKRTGNIL
jgi:hypothetical protein